MLLNSIKKSAVSQRESDILDSVSLKMVSSIYYALNDKNRNAFIENLLNYITPISFETLSTAMRCGASNQEEKIKSLFTYLIQHQSIFFADLIERHQRVNPKNVAQLYNVMFKSFAGSACDVSDEPQEIQQLINEARLRIYTHSDEYLFTILSSYYEPTELNKAQSISISMTKQYNELLGSIVKRGEIVTHQGCINTATKLFNEAVLPTMTTFLESASGNNNHSESINKIRSQNALAIATKICIKAIESKKVNYLSTQSVSKFIAGIIRDSDFIINIAGEYVTKINKTSTEAINELSNQFVITSSQEPGHGNSVFYRLIDTVNVIFQITDKNTSVNSVEESVLFAADFLGKSAKYTAYYCSKLFKEDAPKSAPRYLYDAVVESLQLFHERTDTLNLNEERLDILAEAGQWLVNDRKEHWAQKLGKEKLTLHEQYKILEIIAKHSLIIYSSMSNSLKLNDLDMRYELFGSAIVELAIKRVMKIEGQQELTGSNLLMALQMHAECISKNLLNELELSFDDYNNANDWAVSTLKATLRNDLDLLREVSIVTEKKLDCIVNDAPIL